MQYHLCIELKNADLIGMLVIRYVRFWGRWRDGKVLVKRRILLYHMVTLNPDSDNILHSWKVLRQWVLKMITTSTETMQDDAYIN